MDGKIDKEAVLNSPFMKPYDNSWKPAPTPAQKLAMRGQKQAQLEEEDAEEEGTYSDN
jgi:hypothetical protein